MPLPYFPLHTVLFPHLPLPLNIFEERYRAMVQDLVAENSPYGGRFVVSMIVDGPEVGGGAITRAVGVARASLGVIDENGPYGVVDVIQLDEPAGAEALALVPAVQEALDAYLATVKRFVARVASVGEHANKTREMTASLDEVLKPIHLPDDPVAASYAVGGVLQVELLRKQRLLELPDAASRLTAELALLRRETRLLDDGELPTVPASDLGYHPN